MTSAITKVLEETKVVPLVQSDDPATAVKIAAALIDGGLTVLEVVLRTDAALACLEAIVAKFPDAHVGAGTVLSAKHADEVIARGASFVVSPGLDDASVQVAQAANTPIFPGIATPTELQHAWNLGLRTVKFFPAGQFGGVGTLKALASVFRDVQFMPTGGVSAKNLRDYLAVPAVIACGGSWLTPSDAVASGNYERITELAVEAVTLASDVTDR